MPDTPSSRAKADGRARILAGKRVSAMDLTAKHGTASNILSVVARQMAAEGHRLIRDREPTTGGGVRSYWRLATDDEEAFDPNARLRNPKGQNKKYMKKAAPPEKVKASVVRKPDPAPPALPEMPALGSTMTVRFLMMDDDGGLTVGLVNGRHVWSVVVAGVAER